MKTRIVETLFEFTKPEPSGRATMMLRDIASEINIPEAKIREKAQSVIRHLIHNYASFDISTIDKFTHRVIRTFARDLQLPANFEISLDTESLLGEAVDALIARAGDDKLLTDILVDFALEKTDSDKSWDISREILDTGRLALNENHRNHLRDFEKLDVQEFVEARKKLWSELKKIEEEVPALAVSALDLIKSKGLEYNAFFSSYVPKHFAKVASGFVDVHEGHLKYLEEGGKRYAASLHPSAKSAVDEIALQLMDILIEINRKATLHKLYQAFLKNITPLSLLNSVTGELDKIQLEQNLLSIAEFNAIIHNEIQGQPAPFIYERLGEKYRHFFIDEFQDTSEMQWQNLIPLIDNSLAGQDDFGQKGTLMIVGDPKQSIYRWRGGKAEQFIELAKKEAPFSNKDKKEFSLATNWRSFSEVIDFNNDFFAFVADRFQNPDYHDLYKNKSSQLKAGKTGGYVNIKFVDQEVAMAEPDEDVYALEVLNRIKKLEQQGFKYAEIAVLTRKNFQCVSVAKTLIENSIPIISSESLQLAASASVRFLVDMLRYLYNPNDLESKAQWLYYLGKVLHREKELSDFIQDGIGLKSDEELSGWLKGFDLDLPFSDLRKKALYEAVEDLVSRTIPSPDAYVQYFLDVVLDREGQYLSGIGHFLAHWDEKGSKYSVPSPEGKDAVRIMTIHKSKGLEFPVVIYPYAVHDLGRATGDKTWVELEEPISGLPKLLTEMSSKLETLGPEAAQVYQTKKEEEILDVINVLYVALTRAVEQLFVISETKIKKEGEIPNDMAGFFITFLQMKHRFEPNVFEYGFGEKEKVSEKLKDISEPEKIKPVASPLKMSDIKIARRESLMWGSKQMDAIAFGNALHEILSGIGTREDVDSIVASAEKEGLVTPLVRDEVLGILSEIMNHEDLSVFFDGSLKQMREQTIISNDHRTIKPDRIAIDADGNAYLLDYKTGQHHLEYERQVNEYADALSQMGYNVAKKLLVYTGSPLKVVALS